ncbi:MAG: TRAP transporter small permease [Alkalispirochaeta sp.]
MTKQNAVTVVAQLYKMLLIVLVVAMFLVVGLNVFSRYVLNASLGWADELARFLFIYVSLLGAVLAYHHNDHVSLDLAIEKIGNPGIQKIVRLFGQLLIVLALGYFTFYSFEVAVSARNVSPALYIPMSIVYMVMPVSGFLMFVMAIMKFRPILEGRAIADDHTAEQEALQAAAELKEEAERLNRFLAGDDNSRKGR